MRMYQAYGDDGGKFYIGDAGLEAYGPDILKPPHLVTLPPQPEPAPLTEDELAAIETLVTRLADLDAQDAIGTMTEAEGVADELADRVPALIAEVRRLREALTDERAYHLVFEGLSVLSWADMPQERLEYWRDQARRSLHVATADLHAWINDTER